MYTPQHSETIDKGSHSLIHCSSSSWNSCSVSAVVCLTGSHLSLRKKCHCTSTAFLTVLRNVSTWDTKQLKRPKVKAEKLEILCKFRHKMWADKNSHKLITQQLLLSFETASYSVLSPENIKVEIAYDTCWEYTYICAQSADAAGQWCKTPIGHQNILIIIIIYNLCLLTGF